MELIVDGLDADWDANVLDPKVTDKLAKLLAKDFQGNIQELFEKSQKVRQILLASAGMWVQHSEWFNGKDWAEEYKDADISVSVKVTVRRIGTMVKPES